MAEAQRNLTGLKASRKKTWHEKRTSPRQPGKIGIDKKAGPNIVHICSQKEDRNGKKLHKQICAIHAAGKGFPALRQVGWQARFRGADPR
jgi:hypothetical protein